MIGLVKTTDLLLIGGVGLAAAFFLGLFGKPEEALPAVAGFPDLSWLADLLSGAAAVPDIGASFFEGIAQQLAAMQEQIGAAGATIIEFPTELLKSGETVVGEGVEFLGTTVDDLTKGIVDYPFRLAGGFAERAGAAVPAFDIGAGLLSGVIGTILGIPLGPAAIITGAGSFLAGGFGAVPLAEQLKITGIPTGLAPAAEPVRFGGRAPMDFVVEQRMKTDAFIASLRGEGATGRAPGITPKAPAAKAGVPQYTVLTEAQRVAYGLAPLAPRGVTIAGRFIPFK